MKRVLPVIRFQLVNWPIMLGWPWGILAASFLINLAIFVPFHGQIEGGPQTGGVASIYIMMVIVRGQSLAQFFPFALGLGVTRRTFYLATMVILVAESILHAVLLCLFRQIEIATGGWGISLRFFAPSYLSSDNGLVQFLIYLVPLVVFGTIGIFTAVVHKRWGMNGLFTLSVLTSLAIAALAAILTWQDRWPAVGHWFTEQSSVSLFAGWPVLLGVALAGLGFLTIRRATP